MTEPAERCAGLMPVWKTGRLEQRKKRGHPYTTRDGLLRKTELAQAYFLALRVFVLPSFLPFLSPFFAILNPPLSLRVSGPREDLWPGLEHSVRQTARVLERIRGRPSRRGPK